MLNKLSLFSGIGGDDLASDWAGIQTIAFCEKDKYCRQVLAKHWPGIPIIEDVKDVTREKVMAYAQDREQPELTAGDTRRQREWQAQERPVVGTSGGSGYGDTAERIEISRGTPTPIPRIHGDHPATNSRPTRTIDIVSGGFPCQPHSVAGKRKGSSDERNLWPEVRRILQEIKPRWFVGENVPGLYSSDSGVFFGGILSDLAALGYSVGWCCYGAVDVGALHRRDRVFIVAHAIDRGPQIGRAESIRTAIYSRNEDLRPTTPELCSMADPDQQRPQGRAVLRERGNERTARPGSMVRHSSIAGLPDWAGGEMGQPSPLTEFERPDGAEKEREVERIFRRVFDGLPNRLDGHLWTSPTAADVYTDNLKSSQQKEGSKHSVNLSQGVHMGIHPEVETPKSYTVPVTHRVDRLKALGNAVVPQQIYPIYKAIVDYENAVLQMGYLSDSLETTPKTVCPSVAL